MKRISPSSPLNAIKPGSTRSMASLSHRSVSLICHLPLKADAELELFFSAITPAPPKASVAGSGGGSEGEGPSDFLDPSVLRLPQAGHGLHPAEAFFDPLTDTQTGGVGGMVRCAPIDGGTAAGVASDVQRYVDLPQLHHKIC